MTRIFGRMATGEGPRWTERIGQGWFAVDAAPEPASLFDWIDAGGKCGAALEREPGLLPALLPHQLLCQFANYRSHLKETGRDPAAPTRNVVFAKAISSVTAAGGVVVKPPEVRLLDYEIEIGLVIGRPVSSPLDRAGARAALRGLVLGNDLSARDIQLGDVQAFRAKSFRGFTPLGPWLVVPDPDGWERWDELRLQLWVNDDLRQDSYASDIVHRPLDTLMMLSGTIDLAVGDVILTGTPGGTALRAPGKAAMTIGKLLPHSVAMRAFAKRQAANPAYLKVGDHIRARVATDDGAIDLGEQSLRIAAP